MPVGMSRKSTSTGHVQITQETSSFSSRLGSFVDREVHAGDDVSLAQQRVERATLEIRRGADHLVHFAVAAAHWWDDIVFT